MAEITFPRWGFPEVNFVETNPEKIKSEVISGYEMVANRVLADGDPIRLFLLSIAERIIHLQNCINISGQQNLLTYAQGEYLDALGVLLSTNRLSQSPAKTTIEFTLTKVLDYDFFINPGFAITDGTVTFATDEELAIPAGAMTGSVSATCTTIGTVGNGCEVGSVSTIVTPKAFLESAKNSTMSVGGADEEGDEEYAERLRLATDSFSVAGPAAAYDFHVRSVSPAIIDANVISPAPCEIEIYPLATGGTIPSDDLLNEVKEYFEREDVIPLTDKVTVVAPEAYNYQVNVGYYITRDDLKKSEAIRDSISKAVNEYVQWQQGKVGRPIVPDNLISLVKQAGAFSIDLEALSPASFVELTHGQVAQCTGITITYKGTIG